MQNNKSLSLLTVLLMTSVFSGVANAALIVNPFLRHIGCYKVISAECKLARQGDGQHCDFKEVQVRPLANSYSGNNPAQLKILSQNTCLIEINTANQKIVTCMSEHKIKSILLGPLFASRAGYYSNGPKMAAWSAQKVSNADAESTNITMSTYFDGVHLLVEKVSQLSGGITETERQYELEPMTCTNL